MDDGSFALDRLALARILARPDIAPLVEGRTLALRSDLVPSFFCTERRALEIGPASFAAGASLDVVIRHGLELCHQLETSPEDPVLAGLMAARVAALFAALERDGAALPWLSQLAGERAPTRQELQALWAALASHQAGAPGTVSPATADRLAALWPLLGPAEHLMGVGGDTRLRLAPDTGLNVYSCSPRPRPWAVTFASSTASSVSERGYAGAEAARRRMIRNAVLHGRTHSEKHEAARIKAAILRHYGLEEQASVILAPSGTDGELSALAVALMADPARPLTNLLIAPEETGSGVPLAATGRHFAMLTARGLAVGKGERIAGFPADIELATVQVRAADGTMRAERAIADECRAKLAAALGQGRRVLMHVLDVSKTGFVAPGDGALFAADRAGDVDVVVDACQARLAAPSVRAYIERGFMVLLTGSKFFTGPPFAGALLLPPRYAARFGAGPALPSGLADYFGRFDWFADSVACKHLPAESNIGVACRWAAALAEMEAFAAIGEPEIKHVLRQFGDRVRAGIVANPDLVLHETPARTRLLGAERWDRLATIFTFAVLAPTEPRRPFDPAEARLIYEFLNSDLADALPGAISKTERHLASLRCHIGQPVPLTDGSGAAIGALRICAGARLVSGEPSRAELTSAARLAGEIADALAVLDKISLILRHFERLRAARPQPTYR